MCRTAPNQSPLESTDPGACNGESNFAIQQAGADLLSFEVRLLQNLKLIYELFGAPPTSNVTRSVPSGRISAFDPSLKTPRKGLSSAF